MLVLSRKTGESVMIGEDVSVAVIEIRGDKVRLGIVAPPSVAVHREEIWLRIKQQDSLSKAAVSSPPAVSGIGAERKG